MLEIANLEVVYNEVILVLRGLSIEVRDGQIVALLGANGAGKTTVTRAVTGLLDVHEGKITKGSVTLEGRRIDGDDPSAIVRSGITQVMEGRRVFAELTVDENLITGGITNTDRKAIAASHDRVMTMFPLLADRRKDVAGYLSGGEQQMLAIGRALMTNPHLLILDEATSAVDPETEQALEHALARLSEGRTTISIAHRLSTAERADLVFVFDDGHVVERGRHADLAAAGGVYSGLHESWLGSIRDR